jgi:hypothetical protein
MSFWRLAGGQTKSFGDPKKSGHPVVNKAQQAASRTVTVLDELPRVVAW